MVDVKNEGASKHKSLTPEQQTMWKMRRRGEMKSLSVEDKKAFKKKMRAELDAMSDTDLATTKAALQAEWDKLPADKKEKISTRIAGKAQKGEDD